MHKTERTYRDPVTQKTLSVYEDDNGRQWIPLAKGNYNYVYKQIDGPLVMKIQKSSVDATDSPERSVRLWNLINPDLMPQAQVVFDQSGVSVGWVCPFIEGKQASDDEIAIALIDVFNRTGRIILDATSTNNFLKTRAGNIVCIDVGMALQFQSPLNPPPISRQISDISVDTWKSTQAGYQTFFQKTINFGLKKSIYTVKALIFIRENRPHINQADFLKQDSALLSRLSFGYDYQRLGQQPQYALCVLDDLMPPSTIFDSTALEVTLDTIPSDSTDNCVQGRKG